MPKPTLSWTRSSFCADNACIEVARGEGGDRIFLRDSKNPDLAYIDFSRAQWIAFLDDIRAGRFATR